MYTLSDNLVRAIRNVTGKTQVPTYQTTPLLQALFLLAAGIGCKKSVWTGYEVSLTNTYGQMRRDMVFPIVW